MLLYEKLIMEKDLKWYIQMSFKALAYPDMVAQRVAYNMRRFKADQEYRRGKYNYPERIYFLAGLALGGTTWMKNLLARIPGIYTRPTPMPHDMKYRQNICDSAFSRTPQQGNTLFKTHLNPTLENFECLQRNGVKKILVIYRDFRDVALAHYHRLMVNPKPTNAFDYKDYQAMTKEEGLADMIRETADLAVPWVRGWVELDRKFSGIIHFTRFEELKEDTYKAFKQVLDFYQIQLSEDKIYDIVEASRGKGNMKKNLAKAHFQAWGLSSNFRLGKTGGWKEEFSEEHTQLCKDVLGDALIEFNYEKDLNWQLNDENPTFHK